MRLRMLLSGALLAAMTWIVPADAQRGPPGVDNWEFLGQKTGGFGNEGDSILIQQNEDWHRDRAYTKLRFTAEGNDVTLNGLRLVYINGHSEDLPVDRQIRRGTALVVDLPGERSYLRQIDMRYRSGVGISFGSGGLRLAQGSITVHGEKALRRPPPPPPPPPIAERVVSRPGWAEIDRQSFSRQDDRVELRGGRGDGRFGQIKLRAGDRMEVRAIAVRFRNNEVQHIRVDQRLEAGEETRALDLEGDLRGIAQVTVNLEPRRRPGNSDITLLGIARPANNDARGPERGGNDRYTSRGWQFLGEQTVGFQGDRDEITVNQNEDFYRNRRFRTLHFVAEGNDVYLNDVRVFYINGFSEDFRVDRMLPANSDFALDLRGERGFIKTIVMNYRSRPSFNGRATMKVFGESAGGPKPRL